MNFPVKISYNIEDEEYLVTVVGIPEIYGTGTTEAKAMLDFFQQYELISENPKRIQQIVEKLESETGL
jgi:predicted RNase H-like HicB family nuclease